MMSRISLLAAACVLSALPTHGQERPRGNGNYATVSGLAADSLHGGALAGARIEIEGTKRAAVTDSAGRFTIDSIAPGPHRLMLIHPLLDTLGLSVVSPAIAMSAGSIVGVIMSIPSAQTVQRAKCGRAGAPPGSAALFGLVVAGDLEDPVEGAGIWLTWNELQISTKVGVARSFQQRTAKSGAGGRFMICGLPPDLNAEIIAWHGQDTTAALPVAFGRSFLTMLTLGLPTEADNQAGTASAGSTASSPMAAPVRRRQSVLKGFVTNARGVPIEGATVAVDGASPGGITDASGAFTLRDQPSGSHRLTFRAAGYEPFDIGVNLNSMRVSQIRVSLTEYVPVDK